MKYYAWMASPDHDTGPILVRRGLAWKTIMEEWPHRIRQSLDAGQLCVLGLVTVASVNPADLGRNHQVLAYGYDLGGNPEPPRRVRFPHRIQRHARPGSEDRVWRGGDGDRAVGAGLWSLSPDRRP